MPELFFQVKNPKQSKYKKDKREAVFQWKGKMLKNITSDTNKTPEDCFFIINVKELKFSSN